MNDTPALRCAGLVKRYGPVVAVDGLDLEVRREVGQLCARFPLYAARLGQYQRALAARA